MGISISNIFLMDVHSCFEDKKWYRKKLLFITICGGKLKPFLSQHDASEYRSALDGINNDKMEKLSSKVEPKNLKGKMIDDDQSDDSKEGYTAFAGGKIKKAPVKENNFIYQNSRFKDGVIGEDYWRELMLRGFKEGKKEFILDKERLNFIYGYMKHLDVVCINGRTDAPQFDYLTPDKLKRKFMSIDKGKKSSKSSLFNWNRGTRDKSPIEESLRKNKDTDGENFMNKDSVDAHLSDYIKKPTSTRSNYEKIFFENKLPNYEKMFFETVRMPVRDHLESFNYSLMNVVSLLGENERSSEVEKRIIPKVIYKKLFLNYPTDQLFSVQKDIVTFLKEYQKKIKMIR